MSGSRAEWIRTVGVLVVIVAVVAGASWWWQSRQAGQPSGVETIALGTARAPKVGEPVGDFTATTVEGNHVKLSNYAGKPLWLTFGASWCTGCRTEAPDIQEAYEAAKGNGTTVVAVYIQENATTVKSYADRVGLKVVNVPDPDSRIGTAYQAVGVPMHYFVGRDGIIKDIYVGVLSRSDMDARLKAIA